MKRSGCVSSYAGKRERPMRQQGRAGDRGTDDSKYAPDTNTKNCTGILYLYSRALLYPPHREAYELAWA